MQAPPLRPLQVHHHQYHVLIRSVIPYCSGRSSGLWEVRDSGFLSQHRLSVTSPLGSCSRLSFRGSRSPSRLLPFLSFQMCLPRRWQDPLEPLFTCLLRNLYAGQKATVRTGHGTTDWFQIGEGVHQGCVYCYPYLTYMQSTS